jgi:NAD+ synthase (glutamine-hydrolysing)
MAQLKIALLQAPFFIGNPLKNALLLDEMIQDAITHQADLIITPECALSGYLPEDLLFRQDHQEQVKAALNYLLTKNYLATVVIGLPVAQNDCLYNAAVVIHHGNIIATYYKQSLPNYREFDEKRYFSRGNSSIVFTCLGVKIGLFICEDLWDKTIVDLIHSDSMDLIVSLNASPYFIGKALERQTLFTALARSKKLPIAYVNCVGGQDSLLFDGGSFFMDAEGEIIAQAEDFKKQIVMSYFNIPQKKLCTLFDSTIRPKNPIQTLIDGLTVGILDYVTKNHCSHGVLVALSGGIDSAVTLALAVNALGADKVEAVYMPSRYNAKMSEEDAKAQAESLGVVFKILPIESLAHTASQSLEPFFLNYKKDVTEENIQARIRGLLIMALSNKYGKLVLTTGNKSEYAVGYATLYGDMCGGYAPLKDLYKTQVYAIAHQLNTMGLTIPLRVITRAPSAELSENQLDSQSLPPYDMLDSILELFIEEDYSVEMIHQKTQIDKEIIDKVAHLVVKNEYKRQQSAVGPKVTKRAFGKDRRYPISIDLTWI